MTNVLYMILDDKSSDSSTLSTVEDTTSEHGETTLEESTTTKALMTSKTNTTSEVENENSTNTTPSDSSKCLKLLFRKKVFFGILNLN